MVSVPCRGTTFLNMVQITLSLMKHTEFPSPVGELHFSILTSSPFICTAETCFRPLSGNYISQFDYDEHSGEILAVSVPCRGTTFLNKNMPFDRFEDGSFRPLSGNYISQYLINSG